MRLIITGGGEDAPWHYPASRGGKHGQGLAVDFGTGANPGIGPSNPEMEQRILHCACQAGFTFGGWEPDFLPGAPPHYHFQDGPGPSNVPPAPCQGNGCGP